MATRPQLTSVCVKRKPVEVQEFGCNGKTPQSAVTLPTNAVDLATVEALANAIKVALIANGICA